MKVTPLILLCLACVPTASFAQRSQGNPFAPPNASMHYAPDRTCDLQNVFIELDVDWPSRTYKGHAVNTLSPLRSGPTELMLNAGPAMQISKVTVDGVDAKFRRDGRKLFISTSPMVRGKVMKVDIAYEAVNSKARPFGGEGGFHWIATRENDPGRVGFWTQGETEYNSDWVPTWDYPNDFTTSETKTTVQGDWDVIGNGKLVSVTKGANGKKTYDWKMDQPHATYLLTLVGGPFDIKKDKWEGVDLWYVVPRGKGNLIDDSFGDTKDMLSFYSSVLKVKYPWNKYAQNAMYDFGGGMENVSATTLGEGSLTEKREGYRNMASLNSHELGHQWFGDFVTCKDWGDTWLNESFATFMQLIYFEHSRGKTGYDTEVEDAMQSYFQEARRYKRPISTKMYANGDAMFDSHTYPKGGSVLHTLRRFLGDENFFNGLHYYLTTNAHQPVESQQLCRAMTEATGINCEPFWAQWFLKPGHPVLEYSWTFDQGKTSVAVKQTQDTANGTPIYDIPATVGVISGGQLKRFPIHLDAESQTFTFASEKPDAVLLDPDHDFLRELKNNWADSELLPIALYASNTIDRTAAFRKVMAATPSDEVIKQLTDRIASDRSAFPAIESLGPLVQSEKVGLRSFWLGMLDHPNMTRQIDAVKALAKLPADPATTAKLRGLINDKSPIQVVTNSIDALANWDAKANVDVFKKAQAIPSRGDRIKKAADSALEKAK